MFMYDIRTAQPGRGPTWATRDKWDGRDKWTAATSGMAATVGRARQVGRPGLDAVRPRFVYCCQFILAESA
jgi:hypothetical protein